MALNGFGHRRTSSCANELYTGLLHEYVRWGQEDSLAKHIKCSSYSCFRAISPQFYQIWRWIEVIVIFLKPELFLQNDGALSMMIIIIQVTSEPLSGFNCFFIIRQNKKGTSQYNWIQLEMTVKLNQRLPSFNKLLRLNPVHQTGWSVSYYQLSQCDHNH